MIKRYKRGAFNFLEKNRGFLENSGKMGGWSKLEIIDFLETVILRVIVFNEIVFFYYRIQIQTTAEW